MYRTALTFGCLLVAVASLQAEQSTDEAAKINYADHVLPIFREHCFTCHNANDAKGGLALDSFAALMEGGGSGEIVYDGDADGSRLFQLMTHEDTPVMPPNQDPIDKEKLDIVRQWIAGGLLENSGSKVRKKKGPSLSFAATAVGAKPEVIAMPESVSARSCRHPPACRRRIGGRHQSLGATGRNRWTAPGCHVQHRQRGT